MKTLLYVQNNTFESAHTLEYIVELTKYLNMELKIIHIQFPDTVVGSFDPRNQLFQPTNAYLSNKEEFINNITRSIEILIRAGKIDQPISVEYFSGMPSSILSYLYSTGYFNMLVLENENTKVSVYPYQSIKEIIRTIKCPIWVIPRDTSFIKMTDFAYMTDYQPEDINAMEFLSRYLDKHISSINTIHLCSKNNFQEQIKSIGFETILKERISKIHIKSTICAQDKEISLIQMINLCMEKEHPDLVVALKDNKNFVQRVFYKSFINIVLSQLKKPLLILHQENFINKII